MAEVVQFCAQRHALVPTEITASLRILSYLTFLLRLQQQGERNKGKENCTLISQNIALLLGFSNHWQLNYCKWLQKCNDSTISSDVQMQLRMLALPRKALASFFTGFLRSPTPRGNMATEEYAKSLVKRKVPFHSEGSSVSPNMNPSNGKGQSTWLFV